jgi:hypothetical protein|tara:strand:- start:4007 stop:5521 length:1515 start_codon:yes stop_codon:yes gene_type:complete
MTLAEKFLNLFDGNKRAHGVFAPDEQRGDGKRLGVYKIIKQPPTEELWQQHLEGTQGLGIIPIRDDNMCQWGAIDIDNYSVDHKALVQRFKEAKIVGWVGRSKSGGAHVYFFFTGPIKAETVQSKLTEIAASLGHAESEIFPKQSTILVDRGDTGSGLNMPYFKGEFSTRSVYNFEGELMSPQEFVESARRYLIKPESFSKYRLSEPELKLSDGPPCLNELCQQGFGEGSRNNALFNLGVYARMFDPDNWEALVQRYNVEYLHPPLSHNEVGAVIKQLQRKDYHYKCEDQPIKPFCNKDVCITRKHGVGPAGVQNQMSSLTKIDGDPPIWILDVDGQRLELSTDGLISQTRFQKDCVAQINKLPIAVSQRAWQTRIQLLLDNLTIVEVPPDATIKGEFEDLLSQFCTDRAKGTEREDILQGVAVWIDNRVFFQVKDIKKHLTVNDFNHYTSNKITLRLQGLDADKMFWRVKGKGVHVWSLPQEYFADGEQVLELPDLPTPDDVL